MSPGRFPEWLQSETCGKKTYIPNPFKSTVMNEPNAKETAIWNREVGARRDFNSTRNGNREAEIILSSREGFPRVICVRSLFRIVREDWSVGVRSERALRRHSEGPLSVFVSIRRHSHSFFAFRLWPELPQLLVDHS